MTERDDRSKLLETDVNKASRLGVFEETDSLKKVLMWGEPGSESILGQLLPKKISCFQTQFDVIAARDEFRYAKSLIENEGIEVISVKDLLAKMINDKKVEPGKDLKTLNKELVLIGHNYYEEYKDRGISKIDVLSWFSEVLEADAVKYGEKAAVVINTMVANRNLPELPLSNLLFARDQSNMLGRTWVWSSMKHPIRQPEVSLYKQVLDYSGIFKNSGINSIEVDGQGKFEGGDGIVHNGIVYIGVGGRTNQEGILKTASSILSDGNKLMMVIDEERDNGQLDEMDAMHLDTFWMPCGKNEIVACPSEVGRRKIKEVVKDNGQLKVNDLGWFADYMEKLDVDLVKLTKEEQECYAPNFLNLGEDKIILSLCEGNDLTHELTKRGKKVSNANLVNITKGYGGLHCMTAGIKRG